MDFADCGSSEPMKMLLRWKNGHEYGEYGATISMFHVKRSPDLACVPRRGQRRGQGLAPEWTRDWTSASRPGGSNARLARSGHEQPSPEHASANFGRFVWAVKAQAADPVSTKLNQRRPWLRGAPNDPCGNDDQYGVVRRVPGFPRVGILPPAPTREDAWNRHGMFHVKRTASGYARVRSSSAKYCWQRPQSSLLSLTPPYRRDRHHLGSH